MRIFLLDLWLDLREKRLAPVALLLLAGIIAVPIVLAKGQDEAPPAPAPTGTTAAAIAPVIESQPQEGPASSKLQTFSPRDPFEPTSRVSAATTGTPATGATGTTGTTGTTGATTPTDTGGGSTIGTGPTTGTGTTGTGDTRSTTGETKSRVFTYTVDLRFGEAGDVKAFNDVRRLQLVPDETDPKIVFLGVTTTGKTAVFLIDSKIGVDTGEGRCRPSSDECTFLYLRPDDDHDQAVLSDSDGTTYHLRLRKISRVSVASTDGGNSGSSNGNSNGNSQSDRSPAFTGNARGSSDDATVPGETPPGEPTHRSGFQQFFADSGE